jgi:hypothetical protein
VEISEEVPRLSHGDVISKVLPLNEIQALQILAFFA